MNAEAAPKSKRPTFADDVESSTTGEIKMIKPSHIRADHRNNESRGWAPYEAPEEIRHLLADGRCCFTLEQIEERLASVFLEGQICEVEVALGSDKRPTLQIGYLRHCAFLLAEVRGMLEQIPTSARTKVWGIRAKIVPAPKSQDEWDRASDRNYAENSERLQLTPVQFAFYIKRKLDMFDANGEPLYNRLTLAQKLSASGRSVSKSVIDRHMLLLTARPETLLAVHEGKLKMSEAIKQMRQRGEGATRQSRASQRPAKPLAPAMIIRAIEHADKRPPPNKGLDAAGIVQLGRLTSGLEVVTDETPELVREWFDWQSMSADEAKALVPEKPAREPKASHKKSPGANAKEQSELSKTLQNGLN